MMYSVTLYLDFKERPLFFDFHTLSPFRLNTYVISLTLEGHAQPSVGQSVRKI